MGACPAWYFEYSRTKANAPNAAIDRNKVPVTSSHNWCAARVNERSVVRTAPMMALSVRFRPARSRATRAAAPTFRMVETPLTASILAALKGTMAAPMSADPPDLVQLKSRMKSTWMAGDFGQIANFIAPEGANFVARLGIAPGTRVLDVACGTGNTAIPAARAGASVTGLDIATNLLEQATKRAAAEQVQIRFDEGDAEDLPYGDHSFDVVLTMFGAMFAPRPERVAAELIRVCRPGGLIAMANWTPQGFVGKSFQVTSKLVPPPPVPPPVLWGDEAVVRQRLAPGIAELACTRQNVRLAYPFSPKETVAFFCRYFGPTHTAYSRLDTAGQAALVQQLEALWEEHNVAKDGTTAVDGEYLDVRATRA